jgi:hypothetical protein
MYLNSYAYTLDVLETHANTSPFIFTVNQLVKDFKYTPVGDKVGTLLASGNSTWVGTDETQLSVNKRAGVRVSFMQQAQIIAGKWAKNLKATDWLSTDGSACSSLIITLDWVNYLFQSGKLTDAIIINADNGTAELIKQAFTQTGVLGKAFEAGFGASILHVSANKTENSICSISHIVNNYAVASTLIDVCEEGYSSVITKGLPLDYVKMHDTNTESNKVELVAVRKAYPECPTVSFKQEIGHTMGSSTGVELCLCLDRYPNSNILHLSAGMGGMYGSFYTERLN